MNKYFKRIAGMFVAVAALMAGNTSCTSDLDTMPLDNNQLVSQQVYSTADGYMGVLAKCYGNLVLTGQQGGDGGDGDLEGANEGYSGYVRLLFYLQELSTDNFLMPSSSNGLRHCLNLDWDASNAPVVKWTYQRLYMGVAYCNEFLRECTPSKLRERGLWEELGPKCNEYRAEARMIRAYCYAQLVDLFGNVPIIDETVGPKDLPVQYSRKEVFDFTVKELKEIAGEEGSSDEVLANPRGALYGHVDRVAAWFQLARLYLNAETWGCGNHYADAYLYGRKVIDSQAYPLDKDYRHIFLADNDLCTEIIWPLAQDGEKAQSTAGTNFYVKAFVNGPMDELYRTGVGSRGWGNVRSKTTLVDAFDAADVPFDTDDTWGDNKADKRALFMTALPNQVKETWDENDNMTSTFTRGYSYIKWRNVTRQNQIPAAGEAYTSIDFPLMRTADAYLMVAEAVLRGGGGSRSEALTLVNEIRQRAYMSGPYAKTGVRSDVSGKITDAELTLDFILAERQRELASECVRRTDLIRFGKFTTGNNWDWKAAQRLGGDVADYLKVFPIPEDEMANNPTLDQNAGYPRTALK